jgi:hypothetical protein
MGEKSTIEGREEREKEEGVDGRVERRRGRKQRD